MSPFAKAVVAAIVTGLGVVLAAVQSAVTDGHITADEWGLILSAVLTGVVTVAGVYRVPNVPAPEPLPPPAPPG